MFDGKVVLDWQEMERLACYKGKQDEGDAHKDIVVLVLHTSMMTGKSSKPLGLGG